MDLYHQIKEYLLSLEGVAQWPDLQDLLLHATAHRPRDWQLPVLSCEAVGGTRAQALPLAAAVACLQQSIILVDDMLDRDPRGYYHRNGSAITANLACALQAISAEALAHKGSGDQPSGVVAHRLSRMMRQIATGQRDDVKGVDSEEAYWQTVALKSSPFYAELLACGASIGGADPALIEAMAQFGKCYGTMIQIHDDLNDCLAIPANPDWSEARSPLPILYARIVPHPDRDRFEDLRLRTAEAAVLEDAQQILIRSGAVSYCVHQLLLHYHEGSHILNTMRLAKHDRLIHLLEELVVPVHRMFSVLES